MIENQQADDVDHLLRSIDLAQKSVELGNHPFGACLVGPDGSTLLAEAMNSHSVDKGPGHAEANLCRNVAKRMDVATLRQSTLYTSVEPCCMCSGTIYWTEIGTVVFGMTEQRLADLTGDDPENATMALDCRTVLAAGRHTTNVRGPYPELEDRIVAQHKDFWK